MTKQLVFNHHSLPFSKPNEAEKEVFNFIKIVSSAKKQLGMNTVFIDESIDSSWFGIELASGYFWREWFDKYKNNSLYIEQIRSFRSIATRSPLFSVEDIGGDLELFDVKEVQTNQYYSALRSALWYDCVLCSFSSHSPWDTHPLKVIVEHCESSGQMQEEEKMLSNAFNMSTWDVIKTTLIQERDKNINNGKDLWRQCKTAYPHLKFCGKCPTQLQKWSHRVAILDQIKECLICLNTYAEKMVKKQIKGYSHQQLRDHGLPYKVSGESPSVKNDRKKRQERMFYTTDGKEEFFENHIKLINGFRLHFFPDIKNGCIHIAHIGTHLKL